MAKKGNPSDPQPVGDIHYSVKLDSKTQRRKAKEDIRRGVEPQPTYTTGKGWYD